ncbi:hypothetical protein QZH41_014975 [Actinostola sp. cb2023]|nr:hypothetical protein QZH41_014975 [Actinostola sp. cb2023]
MGKKKKPFIDKKAAHNFQLVHRSQKDPLQADEDSSKHVLVPLDGEAKGTSSKDVGREEKLEERKKFGIDYDDDYDYLQHIKTRTDCMLEPLPENVTVIEKQKEKNKVQFGKLELPPEAFASVYEEDEGLLNLAAPAPDSVILIFVLCSDDDLIGSDDDERHFPSDEGEDYDGHSEEGSGFSFGNEETKSRFTSYSMTSSVIRRNEGLTLLDHRFERVMEEYDEDEIGALDHEEMTGTVNPDSQILNALAEEFEQHASKVHFADAETTENHDKVKSSTRKQVKNDQDSSEDDSDNNDDDIIRMDVAPKEQWDCESILSTYSNLYNHPTLIKEMPKVKPIKLSSKTGIPLGVLPGKTSSKNTTDYIEQMDTDGTTPLSGPRPRHEDKDDKTLRKRTVKEQRKARRFEKKTNKLTFKAEQKRQEQSLLNTKNQQGQKL